MFIQSFISAVSEEAARRTVEEIQHRQTAEEASTAATHQQAVASPIPAVISHTEATQSRVTSSLPTSTCPNSQSSKQ